MGYVRFMSIGVECQQNCVTIEEAKIRLEWSCDHCSYKGYNFGFKGNCKARCPIAVANQEKTEAIKFLRQMEIAREIQQMEFKRQMDEIHAMVTEIYQMMNCPSQLDERNKELDELTEAWLKVKGESKYVRGI